VDLIIGREVGGLEEAFEKRDDEAGRVWARNQGSDEDEDEDEDEEINEGRCGAEEGPDRDREHDGQERMLFQEDRVGEIVAISEMEVHEQVGFQKRRERQKNLLAKVLHTRRLFDNWNSGCFKLTHYTDSTFLHLVMIDPSKTFSSLMDSSVSAVPNSPLRPARLQTGIARTLIALLS
jgi:hypothetical protein